MKRALAWILTVMLLTTSCGQVRYVDVTEEGGLLDKINEELSGASATVLMSDGRSVGVGHVTIRPDSTVLVPHTPGARRQVVSTDRVQAIRATSSRLSGALAGGLRGLGVGFALGAAIGAAEGGDDFLFPSAAGAAIFAGLYVGAVGFGVGALVGVLGSRERTYQMWTHDLPADQDDEIGDLR